MTYTGDLFMVVMACVEPTILFGGTDNSRMINALNQRMYSMHKGVIYATYFLNSTFKSLILEFIFPTLVAFLKFKNTLWPTIYP